MQQIHECELFQLLLTRLLQLLLTQLLLTQLLTREPTRIHEYELFQPLTRAPSSPRSNGSPRLTDDA